MTLTSEQRIRVRQTVLAGGNVSRVNNVNFALTVGTVVPTSVRVVTVHDTLISIHPEWRGHSYFVVNDDIIIVDSGHRIVAMVPVGSSSGQLEDRGGGGGGAATADVIDLSPDEIQQVQIVLNQKGFNIGEPDGVFGSRTRQALIMFQQRQGFQATGQIDSRTVSALGVLIAQPGTAVDDRPGQRAAAFGQPAAGQWQPAADHWTGRRTAAALRQPAVCEPARGQPAAKRAGRQRAAHHRPGRSRTKQSGPQRTKQHEPERHGPRYTAAAQPTVAKRRW